MACCVSLLNCGFLGDTICGQDVDDIFAYKTRKIVVIKDRRLGLMKLFFWSLIFLYIIVYQVLYRGQHFKMHSVNGLASIEIREPTVNMCDPMHSNCQADWPSKEDLPYCDQYRGVNRSNVVKPCGYYDAMELPVDLSQGVLISSYIKTYHQSLKCPEGSAYCPKVYNFTNGKNERQGHAISDHKHFVAGLEDFTVAFDHSFRYMNGLAGYDDGDMQGWWLDCSRGYAEHTEKIIKSTDADYMRPSPDASTCIKRPILCVSEDCKKKGFIMEDERESAATKETLALARASAQARLRGVDDGRILEDPHLAALLGKSLQNVVGKGNRTANSHVACDNVFANGAADFLCIRMLLALAGVDLNDEWVTGEGAFHSLRERGISILVRIEYHNVGPWMLFPPAGPPEYTISATAQAGRLYRHTQVVESSPDSDRRVLLERFGICILIESTGRLGEFDSAQFLVILTASVGLVAFANIVADHIAVVWMPLAREYAALKFEYSRDLFDDTHPAQD